MITDPGQPLQLAQFWNFPGPHTWETNKRIPPLSVGQVHTWLCPLVDQQGLEDLADQAEKTRAAGMIPKSKRAEFLRSRGWLRLLVGHYLAVDEPKKLVISVASNGKPYLRDFDHLRFSLSHSEGFAAIAFAITGEVGIDIERLRPVPDWESLAAMVLDISDQDAIRARGLKEREGEFLLRFSCREARFKANALRACDDHEVVTLPAIEGYVGCLCACI